MGYAWTQKVVTHAYTLGTPPDWWNVGGTPYQAITVASPAGAGDVLERCELFVHLSATIVTDPVVIDPFQAECISVAFLGEVYSIGSGGFPNPGSNGAVPAVLSAVADVTAVSDPDPAHSKKVVTYSTRGYVTSQGVRGPAKYGPGAPELRVGGVGLNVFNPLTPTVLDSSSTYILRALWKTP